MFVNDERYARNKRFHSSATFRWIARIGAAILVTLAAFALASYSRQALMAMGIPIDPEPEPSPQPDPFAALGFHPFEFGLVIQFIVVPIALIYLFSNTKLFRLVTGEQATPRDRAKFFAGLVLIELLTHSYNLGFSRLVHEPPELGAMIVVAPVVIAAGMLGGWKMGLGLGLVAAFLHGTQNLLYLPLPDMARELSFIYQAGGIRGVLHFPAGRILLEQYVIMNPLALSSLWVGVISGLVADVLGKHRFAPLAALMLGAGADLGTRYLKATAGHPVLFPTLPPSMLALGLAMVVLALTVRGVQAETARRKAETAELALTRAELRALRAQINPHFLFNALNTIRYFVRTDPETARRLLLHLSEVFQSALRSGEFVPLQDELSYVESYLALEKARLDERLRIDWIIRAQQHLDHPVPTLILQPIVENAVIHGIAPKPDGGTVRITIDEIGNDLLLRVEDDGPGIPPAQLARIQRPAEAGDTALGLRNVDGRLRALYGEEYRLLVESGEGNCVRIKIPISGEQPTAKGE